MKCKILHDARGSLRVHLLKNRMSLREADILEYYLRAVEGVKDVRVYDRTCDAIITYSCERAAIIRALARFSYENEAIRAMAPEKTGRALSREYQGRLLTTVIGHYVRRYLLPKPVRLVFIFCRAVRYVREGLRCLLRGRIQVPVLDAAAITVSLARGDFKTASSIMFLLRVGEILEDWTHRKSVDDLARSMSLGIDKVWVRTPEGEVLMPVGRVETGDEIVVRMGGMIPLDGVVIEGEASVNQASMTGESVPVPKVPGAYAYAGTVLEEGSCVIQVKSTQGTGKYDQIVRMIEESERLKSAAETRAFHLADSLVPYSLGGTLLTWLLTRNATRALSFLMVDFSCALKLAMPISVLSAIREAQDHSMTVKGGKFMEALARADSIVFDKTGTLTHARPTVARVVTFGGADENECLRLAACLEEHYPHSMANAVVAEAEARGLIHEERHSRVQYVVAHGIASAVEERKVIIGSYHFVFEDEGCVVPAGEQDKFDALPAEYSILYLASGGTLMAAICIEDPLRTEARDVVRALHGMGIQKITMITGDNPRTADAVARKLDLDGCLAGVLPADKADFIRNEHKAGRTVIMVGDGINDTPALSEADVGIAISDGAAIAREVADITIASDSLWSLVTLRVLSQRLMDRIHGNYRGIMTFNGSLIALGVLGVLQPATSALLHNVSTIGIGLKSMTNLLEEERRA